MITEKIIVDGLLTNYQIFKAEGSQTLLFLHGWQSQSAVLGTVAKQLNKEDCSIYALDFPGFGASQSPKFPFSVSDYGKFVESFIKKLNLQNVVLIGHSFGGRIAIKLAAENPSIAGKLVLVDSAGIILKDMSATRSVAKLVKPLFKPKFMHGARRAIYKKIGSSDYLEAGDLKATYLKIISEDLRPHLPQISQPTLLIWGANDEETPLEIAEIMHQEIPKSRLVVLEDAGHFSFIDQPDQFTKELTKFINE